MKITIGIPTYNRSGFLRQSIQSVLAQTYRNFRLIVSDNASTDDTAEVVESFDDPRILYTRTDENIGMTANFNRLLELADTEFVAVLYDDDLFYPEHLQYTTRVLEDHPSVGIVHTAFDIIDKDGEILERAKMLVESSDVVSIEPGKRFLERSMRQDWVMLAASALFRTEAIVGVGGFPVEEEPLPDVPMFRRIALHWDLASVSKPLAACRVHGDASSASHGTFTGLGYSAGDSYPGTMLRQRTQFIDEASLPLNLEKRYRSIAEASFRRDMINRRANRAASSGGWGSTNAALARLIRTEPRSLFTPVTWRIVATQLGGRSVRRFLRRLTRGQTETKPRHPEPGSPRQ